MKWRERASSAAAVYTFFWMLSSIAWPLILWEDRDNCDHPGLIRAAVGDSVFGPLLVVNTIVLIVGALRLKDRP